VALTDRHKRAEEWQDYRTGIIASTIVNMLKGKGGKTYEPQDFMPKQKREQTPEEQLAIVESYMKTIDGEDKRWQQAK